MEVINTTAAAKRMKIDRKTFVRWSKDADFPAPVRRGWWSVKKLDAYINKSTAPVGEVFDAVEENYHLILEVLYGTNSPQI